MSGNKGPNFNAIGKSFVEHYYKMFDTNRGKLKNLFKEKSMVSFAGKGAQGTKNIMNHLMTGLGFKKIQHRPKTLDVQPTGPGLLILVTGQLKVDNEKNPLLFTESFHLMPTDKNLKSWWVRNAIFRLNYGGNNRNNF